MQTFDEKDIKNYYDVFNDHDYLQIMKYLSRAKWRYGHGSYRKTDQEYYSSPPFWIMELNEDEFFSEILFEKIKHIIGKKSSLHSVYANGHMYGTKGRPHQDWIDESGLTFLYYPNSKWDIEWGGKTAFILDRDKYYYRNPQPNSAVLFPGMIWHYAEETSRLFSGLRTTIAWKIVLEK